MKCEYFLSFSVIQLLPSPSQSKYSSWPYGQHTGEIVLVESHGNADYKNSNGVHIGAKRVTSTLHLGPSSNKDKWCTITFAKSDKMGFDHGYHSYELLWNEDGIRFFVDRIEIGFVPVGDGFWKRCNFHGENIWTSGTNMAPFDEKVSHVQMINDKFCICLT